MWIKLLRSIAGSSYTVGEIIEVDDELARSYIAVKYAEEAPAPAEATDPDPATAAEIAEIRRSFADLLKTIKQQVDAAGTALKKSPTIGYEATESEDEKLCRTGAFQSMGHFAYAINRGMKRDTPDPTFRLPLDTYAAAAERITRAATGMNEASDPDGALLIPPTFSQTIWERTRAYYNIADQITMIPIGGNAWQMPADAENSRVDGQRRGGIQGYWEGEAAQYVKSKPTFADRYLRLKKLTALVYVTNENLDDAPALEGYINRVAPEEITFKINDACINGNGAGMPLGLLKSLSRVTVAKGSGQANTTIIGTNITTMWKRLYSPCRANAVWLINQDTEDQLWGMSLVTGSSSGQLIYMPAGGVSQAPYATLGGRPVIVIEQCATLGTEGDIILTDLTQILGIRKASGLQQSMSIHLRFDYDETVFKFSLRMDSQPAWEKPLTPFKGTNTQGAIITLASRP